MIDYLILFLSTGLFGLIAYKYLSFLNDNQGGIIAFLTFILVLTTIFYAKQTKDSVDIMKQEAEAMRRPYVEISSPSPILYNVSGESLTKDYKGGDPKIKHIQFKTTLKNSGTIPAELISSEIKIPCLEVDEIQDLEMSVFQNSPIHLFTMKLLLVEDNLLKTMEKFDGKLQFSTKIKYKIHNTDKVFESQTDSECYLASPENGSIYSFNCDIIKSFTN
ncbi:hypothetical protein KJ632_02460 [Patescibacteria group bacterium]|nr:hypothetical protein [Patescibacteria group bacterium]